MMSNYSNYSNRSVVRTAHATPIVLIVEDDVNLLSGIADVLETMDIQVLRAGHGLEALQVLSEAALPPGVIVSDIRMPFMNGYELLEAVRSETQWLEIPFIFLTALADSHEIRRGMIAGVDDYLTKPFTPDTLVEAIRAKLRRREQLAAARSAQIKKIKQDILEIFNHEFRTPLTPMVAYSELLTRATDNLSSEELRTFIRGIQQGTLQLRRLVEDFILLVELESGDAQEEFGERKTTIEDISRFFEAASVQLAEFAAEKHIALVFQPPATPMAFVGDPVYVQGVLSRLLDNAIKFTDQVGKKVQVWVENTPEHVVIHVADEGRGIEPAEQEYIFDPFYQINRRHFEDQGTGSGLAIVRGIMTLHSGYIQVQSEPGQGSTFSLYFPRS
jgi:signal transduction histidine kinase